MLPNLTHATELRPPPSAGRNAVDIFAWLLLAALAAWLLACVLLVQLEFDDGFSTIANSQYFLGVSDVYFWQRGPLMAWLLLPAEWLAGRLQLAPFDVRPHHAIIAAMHLAYLIGVWHLVRAHFGPRTHSLLGFVAAVPSVLFASYAPFISHDLFPGLILLLMLKMSDEFIDRPSALRWSALVLLGLAAMLVKQTYVLFWVAVGVAHAISLQFDDTRRGRASIKPLLVLAAASIASLALAWLVYSWVLVGSFGEHPFLHGPWLQYRGVVAHVAQGGNLAEVFPPGLYLNNLWAFGVLAMTLAVPGAWLCLVSGNRLQRSTALAWILLVAIMHALPFKEVRYLGFLAPLTSFLVATAVAAILRFRAVYLWPILLVLAIDVAGVGREALRIAQPYYRHEVADFLGLFPARDALAGPVVMGPPLSFIAPEGNAFRMDRFHRITHLTAEQLRLLRGYDANQVVIVDDESLIDAPRFGPGTIVIFSNDILTRRPPFRADNAPLDVERFMQTHAVAERVTLVRDGEDFVLQQAQPKPLLLLRAAGVDMKPLVVQERVAAASVDRLRGLADKPARISLLGFRIQAYCDMRGCQLLH